MLASAYGCGVKFQYDKSFLYGEEYNINGYKYLSAPIDSILGHNLSETIKKISNKYSFTYLDYPSLKLLSNKEKKKVIILEAQKSGRTSRAGGIGYSLKITSTLKDFIADSPVYIGSGECMGDFESDDLRCALEMSLEGLADRSGFDTNAHASNLNLALSKSPKSLQPPPSQQQQAEKASIFTGTGFYINCGLIVTNYHVIQGRGKYSILDHNKQQLDALLVAFDPNNDIALLKVGQFDKSIIPIPLTNKNPQLGQEVFTIGYPMIGLLGVNPKVSTGIINSLTGINDDPRTYQTSVQVAPGNSGGPLINSKGELVGITTSTVDATNFFSWSGTLPQNVNYAVKSILLHNLAQSYCHNLLPIEETDDQLIEKLVKRYRRSVVIIVAE